MKIGRIGFFGGTFDPIHFGHIHLALEMCEKHNLNKIYFCPAATSPYKTQEPPKADGKHRKAMLQRALDPLPLFSILDWELERQSISYTIDTVRALHAQGEGELYLILGEDALQGFERWKEVEELVRLAPPLIGSREALPTLLPPPPLEGVLRQGMTKIPMLDISSTTVRKRLQKKLYCGHLVPLEVLDYIAKHRLY